MERYCFAILLIFGCAGLHFNLVSVEGYKCGEFSFADDQNGFRPRGYAQPGEFPHQVSIRKENFHICGGALVSEQHIITSARCVTKCVDGESITLPIEQYNFTLGDLYRRSNGSTTRGAATITPHPDFNRCNEDSADDLAIIKLDAPVSYMLTEDGYDSINRACLPRNRTKYRAFKLSGWGCCGNCNGVDPSNGFYEADTLHNIKVGILKYDNCLRRFKRQDKQKHFCAGPKVGRRPNGVCGDIGGPLVAYHNNKYILYGIMSRLDFKSTVGLYTLVSWYSDYIDEMIE